MEEKPGVAERQSGSQRGGQAGAQVAGKSRPQQGEGRAGLSGLSRALWSPHTVRLYFPGSPRH